MKFIILALIMSFSNLSLAENKGNFNEWQKLHKIYVDALNKLDPENKPRRNDISEKEFELLQKDVAIREKYMELMNEVEERCIGRTDLAECQHILSETKEYDINTCLGDFDYTFYNEKMEELGDHLSLIFKAGGFTKEGLQKKYQSYSDSNQVKNMIAKLRVNLTKNCTASGCSGKRKPGSKGKCLRYIKYGLLGGGFTKEYSGTLHAKDSGADLKRYGFKNLMSDPTYAQMTARDAPIGAILVYSGGKSGHVEMKSGENEYLSDHANNIPISDYLPRKLIGVYVK